MALLDRELDMINFPYQYGEVVPPRPYGQGLTSKIIDTGEALIINSDVTGRSKEIGAEVLGKLAQSYLGVPIIVEGRSEGVISVQSTTQRGRRTTLTISVSSRRSPPTSGLRSTTPGCSPRHSRRVPRPRQPTRRRARSWPR